MVKKMVTITIRNWEKECPINSNVYCVYVKECRKDIDTSCDIYKMELDD